MAPRGAEMKASNRHTDGAGDVHGMIMWYILAW